MPRKSSRPRNASKTTKIQGDADVDGGDFVARDKLIQNIQIDAEQFAQVIRQSALGKSDQNTVSLTLRKQNPYQGLLAFGETDAEFFHGREMSISLLADLTLRYPPLVAVIGSSGSGKSSLVSAGLIPRLTGSNSDWIVAKCRPGSNPMEELASLLFSLDRGSKSRSNRIAEIAKLAGMFETGRLTLEDLAKKILRNFQNAKSLILVIDQFEELYTVCSDVNMRLGFLNLITTWASTQKMPSITPLRVVLVLRADFLGQALAHRPLADALDRAAKLMLGPMSLDELETAITYPALRQGGKFDDGLPTRILEDAGQEPGNLPLLEFVLTLLWERQESGKLTHRAYDALGRVQGALAHYADQVYARLGKHDQVLARQIFVQLVQPGEGTEDTRRRARRTELGDLKWRVVQDLAGSRLLVTGQDIAGEPVVEVVHEALIQKWSQLRGWMNEDREFRVWQEQLRFAMRQWEASGRDSRALLSGYSLDRALNWLNNSKDGFADTEVEYVNASNERQAKEDEPLQNQIQIARKLRVELLAERQLGTLGRAYVAVEHRISNNLNIIGPNVNRLRKRIRSDDAEVIEILDIIERSTRSTSELLHRIQAPLLESELVEVDINAILSELAGKEADAQEIGLILDLDDSVPAISLPLAQISEVFINLIENSLRVMERHGTLRVKTRLQGDNVLVLIVDTGPGISPRIRERLFKKPIPSKEPAGGLGLGLWLNKLILDSIGGDISISETGLFGTTMVVSIPTKGVNRDSEAKA